MEKLFPQRKFSATVINIFLCIMIKPNQFKENCKPGKNFEPQLKNSSIYITWEKNSQLAGYTSRQSQRRQEAVWVYLHKCKCLEASLKLKPLNSPLCFSRYFLTLEPEVRAYCLRAHPIAFRMKNSSSAALRLQKRNSISSSVSSL